MKKKNPRKPSRPASSLLARSGKLVGLTGRLLIQEALKKSPLERAQAIVDQLTQLRGAALKLGQTLSIELGDLFPPEVAEILTKLHDRAQEMPLEEVQRILRRELGDQSREIELLGPGAHAAASIGQVHRASYRGRLLALKVQFPGIDRAVDSDLAVLGRIFQGSALLLAKKVDFSEILDEIRDVLHQETNYLVEARSLERYRTDFKDFDGIRFPDVLAEISTKHILAMSFESGSRIVDWMKTNPDESDRLYFSDIVLRLYIQEFYQNGFVQTDPNFGNFLIQDRKLVLLDFGATREYSVQFRLEYAELLKRVRAGQWRQVRDLAFQLNLIKSDEGTSALEAFDALMKVSFEPFEKAQFDFADGDYAQRVRLASRNLVRELKYSPPPKALIFLHRKLGGVFHLLRTFQVSMPLGRYLDQIDEVVQHVRERSSSKIAEAASGKRSSI